MFTTLPKNTLQYLSSICFIAAMLSIVGSIAIWFLAKSPDPAHGERFGIFVGLWAPTFLILSNKLDTTITEKAVA
ncbi:MAG: hypothetical protein CBB60_004680 [Armatimonadetes bacterium Cent15-Ar3]|nr:MAG: hypothetical protein CBB60_004680 [Armatimonadetes bacterium Cent15-Ar3]